MSYAETTKVTTENSKIEIERTLRRYGAKQFAYASDANKGMIAFVFNGKQIRFVIDLPDPNDRKFTMSPTGRNKRTPEAAVKEYEQACRAKWRSLLLIIKAKLEAVESRIAMFEEEFLSYMVLPNGQTVGQFMIPQIQEVYDKNKMPPMLPFLEEKK